MTGRERDTNDLLTRWALPDVREFHYTRGEGARMVLDDGTTLEMSGQEFDRRRKGEVSTEYQAPTHHAPEGVMQRVGRVAFETEFISPDMKVTMQADPVTAREEWEDIE